MIEQISEAKSIRELQMSLSQRKDLISTPVLTSLIHIEHIYSMFNYIESYRNSKAIKGSVIQKKRFCFVILRLYSPATILFDEQLPKGLRKGIAKAINVNCLPSISHYCDSVISYYKTYKDFREELDYLYTEIMYRLEAEKIIS